MVTVVKMVKGNNKPDTPFILTKASDGSRVDITSCTLKFKITLTGKTTPLVNSGHETCTITNASQGEFKYVWQTTDTATAGDYEGEVEITWPDTTVETIYSLVPIYIREKKG